MFTFAAVDFIYILPIAIFGGIAAGVYWVMDRMSSRNQRAEERLAEFKDPSARRRAGDESAVKASDAMTKVLEKATPALAKPLQPKSTLEEGKLKQKLLHAGFRSGASTTIFLGMKFVGLMIGLLLSGGTLLFFVEVSQSTLLRAVVFAGGMFYLPDMIVGFIAKRRKDAIFLGLPDTLDLMVVCVEAGLGLDQAMRKVAEEMKKSYRLICEELALCNFQLQMGRARNEVLRDLGQRTGVDDLRSLAAILIQADKFGSSVGQALRVQSDSMRTRRRQLAEEKAAKTAVQLIFPLVLFIFPGVFVVLVGPAGIIMMNEMFPAMQGGG